MQRRRLVAAAAFGLCLSGVVTNGQSETVPRQPFAVTVGEYRRIASLNGAAVLVTVAHREPFHLIYGVLLPASQRHAAGVFTTIFEIYDPFGRQVLPRHSSSCDVSYQWYGRCEEINLTPGGTTRMFVAFPGRTITALQRSKIASIMMLLHAVGTPRGDADLLYLSVDELARAAAAQHTLFPQGEGAGHTPAGKT